MDIVKLKARHRSGRGKSYARKVRVQGWIPAVYYGHDRDSKSIEIDAREFAALVRSKATNHLIDLGLAESGDPSIALIKEVQRHVINRELYFHIDFQHVRMDEKIAAKVPVEIIGIPVGVTLENGVLGHSVQFLSVECLPADIPEKITVDVTQLSVGQSIHVKDITVPNAVVLDSADVVLAVVTHASRMEAEAAAEGAEAAAPSGAAGAKAAKPEKKEGK